MQLSGEPSLSTPREQTAVGLTCVKQTDQICVVSKEIWSSSYSLCRWMGGIRCGFCMVFMIEVGLERPAAWSRQVPRACKAVSALVVARPIAVALRRWRLPSLTHLSTFSPILLPPESPARVVLFRHIRLSTSTSGSPTCLEYQQTRSISLFPTQSHAPRRRIPLFTSSIIAAISIRPTSPIYHQYSTPVLAVLSASTLTVYPTTL